MSSKNTFMRVLFAICLVTGPVLMACEAALDFNRDKIQRYISADGSASSNSGDQGDQGGDDAGEDSGEEPADTGTPPQDSGTDADTGTGN